MRVRLPERELWLRWTAACAAAEALGIGVAALANVSTRSSGPALIVAATVGAGTIEGLALGSAQARILGSLLPSLRRRTWIAVTAAAAALGWTIGMLPAALAGTGAEGPGPPLWLSVLLAVPLGAVMGAGLGFAQWLVLRRHAPARSWIPANVVGWAAAMAWIFAAASWPSPNTAGWIIVAGAVAGGLAGGACLGIATSPALPVLT